MRCVVYGTVHEECNVSHIVPSSLIRVTLIAAELAKLEVENETRRCVYDGTMQICLIFLVSLSSDSTLQGSGLDV